MGEEIQAQYDTACIRFQDLRRDFKTLKKLVSVMLYSTVDVSVQSVFIFWCFPCNLERKTLSELQGKHLRPNF
jgi:hypothetical protein